MGQDTKHPQSLLQGRAPVTIMSRPCHAGLLGYAHRQSHRRRHIMIRYYLRYARYALGSLATVGLGKKVK
jgi:hypothetical protein